MHRDHKIFIEAIKHKKKVSITTMEKSECRRYRPLFYIPASSQQESAHYYVWDGTKGEKGNMRRLVTEQISSIEPTEEPFDPTGFSLVDSEYSSQENPQISD